MLASCANCDVSEAVIAAARDSLEEAVRRLLLPVVWIAKFRATNP
jgi:hypothetical protein